MAIVCLGSYKCYRIEEPRKNFGSGNALVPAETEITPMCLLTGWEAKEHLDYKKLPGAKE